MTLYIFVWGKPYFSRNSTILLAGCAGEGKLNRVKEIRRRRKDGLKINRQQLFVRKKVSRPVGVSKTMQYQLTFLTTFSKFLIVLILPIGRNTCLQLQKYRKLIPKLEIYLNRFKTFIRSSHGFLEAFSHIIFYSEVIGKK